MAAILYKWIIAFALINFSSHHPIFLSVTEIAHNAGNKSLEITCKIFTDDLEVTLQKKYSLKIDLLDKKSRAAMNPLVSDYIQKHLSIAVDSHPVSMQFLGFEQEEEAIVTYFEVKNVGKLKTIEVLNNILYESQPGQMGIIHIMVNGKRKSSQLTNPEAKAGFQF